MELANNNGNIRQYEIGIARYGEKDSYVNGLNELEQVNDAIRNDPCNYLPDGCMGGTAKFVRTGDGFFTIQLSLDGSVYDFAVVRDLGVYQCNCFTAGTTVLTDEGEKPIEEIQIGDKVLAKDSDTGEMSYQEVELLFRKDVEETYNITVNGEVITTTDEHPFWIEGKGWVKAKDLQVREYLQTSEDEKLMIEKIEVKKEHRTVYNFRVKNYHTYYVSNLHIWTHNQDSCGAWSYGPANTYVYYGMRGNEKVYVGITNDIERRTKEHGSRFDRLVVITEVPIQRRQARAIETYIINNSENLENPIRSIAPKRTWYNSAMTYAAEWVKKYMS